LSFLDDVDATLREKARSLLARGSAGDSDPRADPSGLTLFALESEVGVFLDRLGATP
jgi:hypothetical protein